MIEKLSKKIWAFMLTVSMVIGMSTPVVVNAANGPLDIDFNSSYAMLASSGKAVEITTANWSTPVDANGNCVESNGKYSVGENALVKFNTVSKTGLADNQIAVNIKSNDTKNIFRSEQTGSADYVFADERGIDDSHTFIIEKIGENKGILIDNFGRYIALSDAKTLIRTTDRNKAEEFTFVKDVEAVDFTLYIENTATGKYVKANGVDKALTVDGEKTTDGKIGDDLRWTPVYGVYKDKEAVTFNSKATPNSRWKGGSVNEGQPVTQVDRAEFGGWESIRVVPNGDGTISFKDTDNDCFFTVDSDSKEIIRTNSKETAGDNGKFIIHTVAAPDAVTDVTVSKVTENAMKVSFTGVSKTIYTGYQVVATPEIGSGKATISSNEFTGTSTTLTGLENGTTYSVTVKTLNATCPAATSKAITATTKNGPVPVLPTGLSAKEAGKNIEVSWKAVESAISYDVYRAKSAFDKDGYTQIASDVKDTKFVDEKINDTKYNNYYKVVATNENGKSELSDEYTSLETAKFGKNMIFFAPTDDAAKIDEVVQEIFVKQNDVVNDAQFNGGNYGIYYKPGDYVNTQCVPVGFNTHIGGLGKTPYDVQLNNIEVPAYLDGRSDNTGDYGGEGGSWRNATCNFWRSAENVAVVGTGEATTVATTAPASQNWKSSLFNWSVAQAAPLRRVYSTREVSYDWSYGWASGGYVADCLFTGNAGTPGGQQFFTRNSVIKGNANGTTLNNFNIGVISDSLPNATTGKPLADDKGYSNWTIGGDENNQQVTTNVTKTPESKEKPFLFIDDDGEYKVFVPALRKDTSGVSWGEGKANGGLGEGKILSLDKFYVADEKDSAKTINEKLAAGKNIFFTPGKYHAEEVIKVNNADTILLGTGMATIVADNSEAAMEVADVDGVTVAGLIFDAGKGSDYLLKVGTTDSDASHSDNPIILQDLFFRVGGTTKELTQAKDALEINSNDVLCDHFWIWRADHGAGVAWDGNESNHGLIVNGDNVSCYALFNEHFQEYDTLWNGENGSTYFYQNEKCYDPISQDAWMSHKDTTKGYAAYKVANKVEKHYAIGLGIYNVFIYTGPTYDSTEVQIQMDNAIEVPNKENVTVENACIQTFAKSEGVMQKFNHIINGVGAGVSSGIDKETGEIGEDWSRKFLISYNNGTAVVGKVPTSGDEKGKYLGVETINDVKQPMNEAGDVDLTALQTLFNELKDIEENAYTAASYKAFKDTGALGLAQVQLEKGEDWAVQKDVNKALKELTAAKELLKAADDITELEKLYNDNKDLDLSKYTKSTQDAFKAALKDAKEIIDAREGTKEEIKNAIEAITTAKKALVDISGLKDLYATNKDLDVSKYTKDSQATFKAALKDAKDVLDNDKATTADVEKAYADLDAAVKGLKVATVVDPGKPNGSTQTPAKGDANKTTSVKTGDNVSIELLSVMGMLALGTAVALKKKEDEC